MADASLFINHDPRDAAALHDEAVCGPAPCPIHAPSKHKMLDWPMAIRTDPGAYGLIERMCVHGSGHPDPDSLAFVNGTRIASHFVEAPADEDGVVSKVYDLSPIDRHGCDGCCQ